MGQYREKEFNLCDERWIPVQDSSGKVVWVGLREVLLQAECYKGLAEVLLPPDLVGLYRILLAILHRALVLEFGCWDDRKRAEWLKRGVPREAIEKYLEKFSDRFWLFHPTHPFLQVAALNTHPVTATKRKPWTYLRLDRASGNNPVLFDHSLDDSPLPVPYAEACQHLIGFLQFTPGGLVKVLKTSDVGGPLADSAAVVPLGSTLAETLLLALHPAGPDRDDLPSWEKDPVKSHELEKLVNGQPQIPTGPNSRYSWLSRSVLLLREDAPQGTIRWIRLAPGIPLSREGEASDPMVAMREGGKKSPGARGPRPGRGEAAWTPLTFEEARAAWRELPSWVPAPDNAYCPAVLNWARLCLLALGDLDKDLNILAAGLASEQAKVVRWRVELIRLPGRLVISDVAARILRNEVERSEKVYMSLRDAFRRVAHRGDGQGDVKAHAQPGERGAGRGRRRPQRGTNLRDVAEEKLMGWFFQCAERALPDLVRAVASNDSDTVRKGVCVWRKALLAAARQSWDLGIRVLGFGPEVLQRWARECGRLWQHCRRELNLKECEED